MSLPKTIPQVIDELEAIADLGDPYAKDERITLIRRLGEALEPMPEALKSEETQVRGCASKVWVYPVPGSNKDSLRFFADSNTAITKGIIALILMVIQGMTAKQVLATNIENALAPLGLQTH